MTKHIIVIDKPEKLDFLSKTYQIVTPYDFIHENFENHQSNKNKLKIINLCNNFDYLSKGYYVSLLAESRGMSCIPNANDIVKLNWKQNYGYNLPELNAVVEIHYTEKGEDPLTRIYTTYFGRHENPKLEPITRYLFDIIRFPVISFTLAYNNRSWKINKIKPGSISCLPEDQKELFSKALNKFTGYLWYKNNKKVQEKYWLAILNNPLENYPPSNKGALEKFIKIGKQNNVYVELINKSDYSSLLEYDALFIRETTAINHHTYRFAHKAEQEGIPCIDDTESIIKCGNKVFLNELLNKNNIGTPKTTIIDKSNYKEIVTKLNFPVVLKIPDGAFSKGVFKVNNSFEYLDKIVLMLKKSELIIAQEFIISEFDWRIGILNNEVIFASKYYMAKGHWQIYNHNAKGRNISGNSTSLKLEKVPKEIINASLHASKLIGNGLYGVDLKQTGNGDVLLIEINDNPNIDKGVEDTVLGNEIYHKIIQRFIDMIDA